MDAAACLRAGFAPGNVPKGVAWSPDGTKVAFYGGEADGDFKCFKIHHPRDGFAGADVFTKLKIKHLQDAFDRCGDRHPAAAELSELEVALLLADLRF